MTDMKQTTLGHRIQALRKQQGLTQDALAELMGVSPQAVSKWENNQSCPDIMTLPRLARQLEVSIDLLLTGEDAATSATPAKKPEELVVRMAIEEQGEVRICVNLPFIVFRHTAMHNMLSITYTPTDGSSEVNLSAAAKAIRNTDFKDIVQMIEAGMRGTLLALNDEDMKLTIWTE